MRLVLMAPKRVGWFPDLPAVTELGYKVPPGNWRAWLSERAPAAPSSNTSTAFSRRPWKPVLIRF